MSTFLSYCKNGSISSKTEKTNIGIIDENKKKELLKELDKQFSISPDYNVIEKAVQKYFKEIKKIDFWFNVLTKKIEITAKGDSSKFIGTIELKK